jgi:surface antigen
MSKGVCENMKIIETGTASGMRKKHFFDKIHIAKARFVNSIIKSFEYFINLCKKQFNTKGEFRFSVYFSCLIALTLTIALWTSFGVRAFGIQEDAVTDKNQARIASKVSIADENKSELSQHLIQVKKQNEVLAKQKLNPVETNILPAPAVKSAAIVKAAPAVVKADTLSVQIAKKLNTTTANYSNDPFQYPQCVWYVWARAKAVNGTALEFIEDSSRDAKNWLKIVSQTDGVKVVSDKNAVRTNAIAVFSKGGEGNGHVVFIEKVVTSKSGKPLSVTISESNWGPSKKPSVKTLSWGEFRSRSSNSLIGYIYL